MSYMIFRPVINKEIKIKPLEVAGRGKRIGEPCFHDIRLCAKDLFTKNEEVFMEDDYAIFAHSMGTLITYELMKLIKDSHCKMPKHIFFSGRKAPYLEVDPIIDPTDYSKENLLKFMRLCGDIPDLLLKNRELMDMSLRILKEDLIMANEYKEDKNNFKLDCDISILYGIKDVISCSDMSSWESCTTGQCKSYSFHGDHFYYREYKKEVADIINKTLL